MRAVQVMATYFGPRRHFPSNEDEVKTLIANQIEWHRDLDLGYPTDLLVVNHDIGLRGVRKFLNQFEGTQTFNGKVHILYRQFLELDISYASYKYAFLKQKSKYDYWFFNEDDLKIRHPGLVRDMVELLESDPNLGYIATCNFVNHGTHLFEYDGEGYITRTGGLEPHAHGGCGLTSTKIFMDVWNKWPDYMYTANILQETTKAYIEEKAPGGYMEGLHEIDFSNRFLKAGYKMKCISNGSSFLRMQDGKLL